MATAKHGRGGAEPSESTTVPAAEKERTFHDRRRLLLRGMGAGSVLLSAGAAVGACGPNAAMQPQAPPPGQEPPGAGGPHAGAGPSDLPTLRGGFGASASGERDDAAALRSVPAGAGVLLTPGIYRIGSGVTIGGHLWMMPGAVLAPDPDVVVDFADGAAIVAGHHQIFGGAGGFANLHRARGEHSALWAPGGDLGARLNAMIGWGSYAIAIPAVPGLTISTPVTIDRAIVIYQHAQSGIGNAIRCSVGRHRAVFQCVPRDDGPLTKNYEFRNLYLVGASSDTPACAFWTSSGTDRSGGDINGGKGRILGCFADGHWGVGVWLNTSGEEMECDRCRFYRDGSGDYYDDGRPRAFPRRACIVMQHRNPGEELRHTGGSRYTVYPRSNSAHSITNADLWNKAGDEPDGACIALHGFIEDCSIDVTYGASAAGSEIVWDAHEGDGVTGHGRGIHITYRGRNEGPGGGGTEGGVPFMKVDNHGEAGAACENITLARVSHYAGHQAVVQGETGSERLPGLQILDVYAYRPHNRGDVIRPLIDNVSATKADHGGQVILANRQAYTVSYLAADMSNWDQGHNADNQSFYSIRTSW